MKPVRIFRHIACEGPAYLGSILERRAYPYEIVCIDDGQPVPADIDDVAGLVFLGGNMSANDPLAWISDEFALIRRAHEADLPMLGVCLGSQLISKALGGTVSKGDKGQEIGWHLVEQTASPACKTWLADLPQSMLVFHWHGETFSIPDGAETILSSACYANQAFVCGKTLGLQFHLEMLPDMVPEWLGLYSSDLEQGGQCNQSAAEITAELDTRISGLHQFADSLFERWLLGVEG